MPVKIEDIDVIETLIIDDGSTDRTIEVGKKQGADHITQDTNNRGLVRSFRKGLDTCMRLGADIIVNADGNNPYIGKDIAKLVQPVIDGEAHIVIGDHQTHKSGGCWQCHYCNGKGWN